MRRKGRKAYRRLTIRMPHLRLLILCFTCIGTSLQARCGGSVALAQIHDAYFAILSETGGVQRSAAQNLLVVVGGSDAETLARQAAYGGLSVDPDRLSAVLKNGTEIAQTILTGRPLPANAFDFTDDVTWLDRQVQDAPCENFTQISPDRQNRTPQTAPSKHVAAQSDLSLYLAGAFVAICAVAALVFGIYTYRKSHGYRKNSYNVCRANLLRLFWISLTLTKTEICSKPALKRLTSLLAVSKCLGQTTHCQTEQSLRRYCRSAADWPR